MTAWPESGEMAEQIPGAKIGREAGRIWGRIADAWTDGREAREQARDDAAFPAGIAVTEGAQPLAARVALVVLYQPGGVAASLDLTLAHLAAGGYAVCLVSNAPLSGADRVRLAARVWRIAERPNRGHDFGAWRDGLRLLDLWGMAPDRLVLLNDSVWFPLSPEDDLLARMEATGAPFLGPSFEMKDGRPHRAHYQSFLLMADRYVLGSPAWRGFWAGYRVSSNRRKVLLRGEKGLSQAMFAGGLSAAPMASRQGLRAFAATAPEDALREALTFAADPARATRIDALLAGPATTFRDGARALLDKALAGGSYLETYPLLAARAFGLSFIKKRAEPQSTLARAAILRAIDANVLPAPDPRVLAEMRARTPTR